MTAVADRAPRSTSMTRSGHALLASSVITAALGLGYWALAARRFDEAALGRGAAMVSALLLISTLATAGLKRGLIRFVPSAGSRSASLVARVYLVAIGVSAAYAAIFLVVFRQRFEGLEVLDVGVLAPSLFLLGTVVWGIFVLEDAALIGARRAGAVPLTNGIFSLAKIGFLFLGGVLYAEDWGIFASWVVPAAIVGLVVNAWLFGRVLPSASSRGDELPHVREIVRFNGGEYLAALAWQSANYLTPLIVVAQVGASANAEYYLAAQLAYGLFLVSSNLADALVAEGATAGPLGPRVARCARQIALLLVPAVAVAVAGAPRIMAVFGEAYTGDGATALRLLAVAAIPNAVITVVVAVAHVRRQLWMVLALQVTMASLTLGGTWLAVSRWGVPGVAGAWLVAQSATCVLALVLVVLGDARRGASWSARAIGIASGARSAVAQRRAERQLAARLRSLPPEVMPEGPHRLLGFQHDLLVVRAGSAPDEVIVRLAAGPQGRRGIAAHRSQLRSLHERADLRVVQPLIPQLRSVDEGAAWLVESAVPGVPMSACEGPAGERAVRAGIATLRSMHEATSRRARVDGALADQWVHQPVATVAEVVRSPAAARGLAILHERLAEELVGTTITVAQLHGDPSPDNLLCRLDGTELTGMVDWESAVTGPPECDLMVLLLARRGEQGTEMGASVADLLANGWSEEEVSLLGPGWSSNAQLRPTTLVLLTWLSHVNANLEKTDRYRRNRWWIRHNVEQVLERLAADGPAGAGEGPSVAPRPFAAATPVPSAPAPEPARRQLSARDLRATSLASGACAVLAITADLAPGVRAATVLVAAVVVPALVIGRCLGTPGPLLRGVIGVAGAVSLGVVAAEVLLYAGWWSPGLWLSVVICTSFALTWRIPPFQPTRPTPAVPADAIVRRARTAEARR